MQSLTAELDIIKIIQVLLGRVGHVVHVSNVIVTASSQSNLVSCVEQSPFKREHHVRIILYTIVHKFDLRYMYFNFEVISDRDVHHFI